MKHSMNEWQEQMNQTINVYSKYNEDTHQQHNVMSKIEKKKR